MASSDWTEIDSRDGRFMVNWDGGVWSICRSHARSEAMLRLSKVVDVPAWSRTDFPMNAPRVRRVEVDWHGVEAESLADTLTDWLELKQEAQWSMCGVIEKLKMMRYKTIRNNERFGDLLKSSHKVTMGNIDQTVKKGEMDLKILTTIRDLCADAVMVGATLLTGGAAAAFVGIGAGMKGSFKYQDTHNWKSAVATMAVEGILGYVGIKVSAARALNKERMEIASTLELKGLLGDTKALEKKLAILAFVIPAFKASAEVPLAFLDSKTFLHGAAAGYVKYGGGLTADAAKKVLEKALGPYGALVGTAALTYARNVLAKKASAAQDQQKVPAPKSTPKQAPVGYPWEMAAAAPIQQFIELTAVRQTGSVFIP